MGILLLQYVDDTTFFVNNSVEKAKELSTLLDIFADCLGLHNNNDKLYFVGFGLSQQEAQCSITLGMPAGSLPV